MQFLPDVYVPCEVCKGRRYNRETLEVRYKGQNIAEVLDLTVADALEFFERPAPHRRASCRAAERRRAGLHPPGPGRHHAVRRRGAAGEAGHRAAPSATRAARSTSWTSRPPASTSRTSLLLDVLHRLVDKGNTVVVIEHNLDVIKTADWIIDLGPEGGERRREVVARERRRRWRRRRGATPGSSCGRALGRSGGSCGTPRRLTRLAQWARSWRLGGGIHLHPDPHPRQPVAGHPAEMR